MEIRIVIIFICCFFSYFILFSQTPPAATSSPFQNVFNYDFSQKIYPIYYFELVAGPSDIVDTGVDDVNYVIGDVMDPYSHGGTLKRGGDYLSNSWSFSGILRFYGQVPMDDPEHISSSVIEEDRFSYDLEPIYGYKGARKECQDKNCSFRHDFTTHPPNQTPDSGSKHYYRWGGIDDGSNSLSQNIDINNRNAPPWSSIKYRLSLKGPGGVSIPQNDVKEGDFSQPNVILFPVFPGEFLDYPYTKDIKFIISLGEAHLEFPIPTQNCYPGPSDKDKLTDDNTYLLSFDMRFPYVKWETNDPASTSVTPRDSGWISMFKTKIFVWDARPPKVEITNAPSIATTGDPLPEGSNFVEFKVTDDNPFQEITQIVIQIKNEMGDVRFEKIYEGDDLKNLKNGIDGYIRETRNRNFSNPEESYVANCRVVFPLPPDRNTALNDSKYFIVDYDHEGRLDLQVSVKVKYGLPSPSGNPAEADEQYVFAQSETVGINVVDNDPPVVELKFSPNLKEIKEFVLNGTSNDKKNTGIVVGDVSPESCLDLLDGMTPLKILVYKPNNVNAEFITTDYETLSGTRHPGYYPVGIEVTRNIVFSGGKKLGDFPVILVEDNRYFFSVVANDNCTDRKDIKITLEQESDALTLGFTGTGTQINVPSIDASGSPRFHTILFPDPEGNTYVKFRVEDRRGNYTRVEIPIKILNSVMNWTTLEY